VINTDHLVIRIVKFRRLSWAGHVVRMGETRNVYRTFVEKHDLEE